MISICAGAARILGREIARMQEELERVIQVAGLKNDPMLPLVKVLSSSLRLQWRLHNQAVRYFHDASDRLDREYHDTIKKTGLVIKQGEVALQARQAGIVEQLTPQLAGAVSNAVRQHVKIVKYRTSHISRVLGGLKRRSQDGSSRMERRQDSCSRQGGSAWSPR